MVSRALVFGEDYTIWDETLDRDLLLRARDQKRIVCHCGKSLTYVDAVDKIPHFRHLRGNCRIVGEERDTETHREGVEFLGQHLRKTIDGIVEKERIFKVPGGLRRTDIFVTLKDGTTICYELQCSPIRESEFRSRTAAYNGLGHAVIWIFGPDASGIFPKTSSSALSDGSMTAVKRPAFLVLKKNRYVALYFSMAEGRFRIAYCADGKFNKTRDVPLYRVEQTQLVYPMPEVKLAMFRLEFGHDGFPYIENFEQFSQESLNEVLSRQSKRTSSYGRELARHGLLTEEFRNRLQGEKSSKKTNRETTRETRKAAEFPQKPVIRCLQCRLPITDQHYHLCNGCGMILCDQCTMRIEKDLHQNSHNLTGQVKHCEWVAASNSFNQTRNRL
jgi:hypothetical protein